MNDLERLKKKNLLERVGLFAKYNKTALISLIIIFVIIQVVASQLMSLSGTGDRISLKLQLNRTNEALNEMNVSLSQVYGEFEDQSEWLKDREKYKNTLDALQGRSEQISSELSVIERDLQAKDKDKIKAYLSLSKRENGLKLGIIEEINKSLSSVSEEMHEILQISQYLSTKSQSIVAYESKAEADLKERYQYLALVDEKGKTPSVKKRLNDAFTKINDCLADYKKTLKDVKVFDEESRDQYTLSELQSLKIATEKSDELITKTDQAIDFFDRYLKELQEQYYTVVIGQYRLADLDFITEPNPKFKEWQEKETYQDQEWYTEREYVGSRIVNNQQEDIYENVKKSRIVTKTRKVLKDNGLPRTITVSYDVYSYYYKVDKYTPQGVTTESIRSGQKHEKYDRNIESWDYKPYESVGYVRWKQLWNDEQGMIVGTNVKPKLE